MPTTQLWDWNYARDILPRLLEAFFKYTLGITVAASIVAIVLGLVLALGRRSAVRSGGARSPRGRRATQVD